jgi:tetratricopeptide (TPR) repeat protein
MRVALIIAPWDRESADAGVWSAAVAWLGGTLAGVGFHVVLVDEGDDIVGRVAHALERVEPYEALLVHISGRLVRRGVIGTSGGSWVPLRALGDAIAGRGFTNVSILAELVNDDDPHDILFATEHVTAVTSALQARERGFALLAAVRSALSPISGFAFTRLLLGAASSADRSGALLSSAYGRVSSMPERLVMAQGVAFVPGRVDLDLAPPLPLAQELDTLIATATDAGDWRRTVELRRMRLQMHESQRARVRELVSIARILQSELDDPEGAVEALEEARSIDPERVPVLQALRRGYERLGRWASAIETVGALADLAPTASDRAELRFARARLALDHLQDVEHAIAWLEATLEDDPMHGRARRALHEALTLSSTSDEELDAQELEENALEEDEKEPDADEGDEEDAVAAAAEGGRRGGGRAMTNLAREWVKTRDAIVERAPPPEAKGVGETAPTPTPDLQRVTQPPPAFAALVSRDTDRPAAAGQGTPDGSADGLSARPSHTTGAAVTYAREFASHRREGRTDRAFLAALVLEELGTADVDQQILIDQFRSVAPIRALGTLDGGGWALLRAPGTDEAMEALFGAVARVAIAVRLDQLAERGRLVELDPVTQVDDASTTVVARTFHWAARVLGVPCPSLFVVDQVPGEIAAVRAYKASTAVGPSIVRGRSPKELAFLAGRHLTYYRTEHEVALYYPTREDLIRLLFASVQLVRPKTKPPEGANAVAALRDRLAAIVTDRERGALFNAVRLLESRGGKASVGAWTRGVEMTATRAGLLLCGDLATAMALVRSEARRIAGLTLEEKRNDLLAYCASEGHAALRARFAVTAPESVRPQAPEPYVPAKAMTAPVESARE